MGGSHYSNINCIAHYGITTGREGGTQYAPHANVTRSQMALFLSRMAVKADIDLDDDTGAGFTDLDGIGADRVDAINRLVNAGIMTGSGNNTFSPLASVTRAEMALWLVNFMVGTTSSDDFLNVKRNPNDGRYSIEDTGTGETIGGGSYFGDSRATQPGHVDSAISAAFELGITTGYSDSTFKPSRTVSRQEMASFIVRTLAHTNARPKGLTAQRAGNDIQVSMRNAKFRASRQRTCRRVRHRLRRRRVRRPRRFMRYALHHQARHRQYRLRDRRPRPAHRRIRQRRVRRLGAPGRGPDRGCAVRGQVSNSKDRGFIEPGFPTGVGDRPLQADDLTIWAWTGQSGDEIDDEIRSLRSRQGGTVAPHAAPEA